MTAEERFMVAFVTTANPQEAEKIATAIVEERLAACVNVLPACRSVYRWEGKTQHDEEALMIVKTSASRFADLEKRILALHSYDVPEIIAIDLARISPGYLSFLHDSLTPDS